MSEGASVTPLPPFNPDLHERAWASVPHPTLPLIATAHAKSATVYSLSTLSSHSALTGGHSRSVRSLAWKPNLPPHKLCLVSGSFDSTAGLWRWDDEKNNGEDDLEREVTAAGIHGGEEDEADKDWEFTLVLEGHESEIKCATFSPSGGLLATSSRDKTIWIWEDIGATEADDEWETIAVLTEHEGDVKAVAWCPDVPGRNLRKGVFGAECLASASYDDMVRIWREDSDGEWVCVAVLEGHKGTVWGVQWEGKKREGDLFPRLLTHSADGTIRIWTLQQESDDDGEEGGLGERHGLGGIPNTMRRSLREEWVCTDILPKVHEKDIYSVTWSSQTGIVASTGSDGMVGLYKEVGGSDDNTEANGTTDGTATSQSSKWKILTTVKNSHGPFEVNHITWCKRYDAQATRRGEEEMLVTTGDDGLVRPWAVELR